MPEESIQHSITEVPKVFLTKQIVVTGIGQTELETEAPAIYDLINSFPASTSFIFNIERLTFLNSKGIGYFTHWFNEISNRGQNLYLTNPLKHIYDTFQMVGLTQMIPFSRTLEEAEEQVKQSITGQTPALTY